LLDGSIRMRSVGSVNRSDYRLELCAKLGVRSDGLWHFDVQHRPEVRREIKAELRSSGGVPYKPDNLSGRRAELCVPTPIELAVEWAVQSKELPSGQLEVRRAAHWLRVGCHLTPRLSGRAQARPGRRERTLFSRARGAFPQAHHGPLQAVVRGT